MNAVNSIFYCVGPENRHFFGVGAVAPGALGCVCIAVASQVR